MEKKTIFIITGIVVGLSITAYFFKDKLFGQKTDDSEDDEEEVENKATANNGGGNGNFPLEKGSRGSIVKELQLMLNKVLSKSGSPLLTIDGVLGNLTQKALAKANVKLPITVSDYTSLVVVTKNL